MEKVWTLSLDEDGRKEVSKLFSVLFCRHFLFSSSFFCQAPTVPSLLVAPVVVVVCFFSTAQDVLCVRDAMCSFVLFNSCAMAFVLGSRYIFLHRVFCCRPLYLLVCCFGGMVLFFSIFLFYTCCTGVCCNPIDMCM